ncbi:hypothetical protein F5Y13DRAFT_205368 [Hypoxylon sp. FL1857]|nr:hypothetical protein F5Y13DRAFT_205368 [Hypoxylon sp. FL1857]
MGTLELCFTRAKFQRELKQLKCNVEEFLKKTLLWLLGQISLLLGDRDSRTQAILKRLEYTQIASNDQLCRRIAVAKQVAVLVKTKASMVSGETPDNTALSASQDALLALLGYQDMGMIDESISDAYEGTCQWIFDKNSVGERCDGFLEWIVNPNSRLYRIGGREGTGKSTAMKHIWRSQRINRDLLEEWVPQSASKLCCAAFFFGSRSKLMTSKSGFLRAILYQILAQRPDLMPVLFPGQYRFLCLSHQLDEAFQAGYDLVPTVEELHVAMLLATSEMVGRAKRLRMFILIDGLDDCDGNSDDIANLINDMAASEYVKLVVSSREDGAFATDFSSCPRTILQETNAKDIKHFVFGELKACGMEDNESQELSEEIYKKSEGSFRWAARTIKSLQRPVSKETILQQLRTTPGLLYERRLEEIQTQHRADACRLLRLMMTQAEFQRVYFPEIEDLEPITLLELSLADMNLDISVARNVKVKAMMDGWIKVRCESVRGRLESKCPEFIYILDDSAAISATKVIQTRDLTVRFSQPMIFDYFLQNKDKLNHPQVTIKPRLLLFNSVVFRLKTMDKIESRTVLWDIAMKALLYAHYLEGDVKEVDESCKYMELLKELDGSIQQHHINLLRGNDDEWVPKTYLLNNMIKSDKGWESQRHAAMHWSNFHPTFKQSIAYESSFLAVAVQFGLTNFVSQQLQRWKPYATWMVMRGRPLLDYALNPMPGVRGHLVTSELVQLLLSYGARPNWYFGGVTTWESALKWLHLYLVNTDKSAKPSTDESMKIVTARLKIFALLLQSSWKRSLCSIRMQNLDLCDLLERLGKYFEGTINPDLDIVRGSMSAPQVKSE